MHLFVVPLSNQSQFLIEFRFSAHHILGLTIYFHEFHSKWVQNRRASNPMHFVILLSNQLRFLKRSIHRTHNLFAVFGTDCILRFLLLVLAKGRTVRCEGKCGLDPAVVLWHSLIEASSWGETRPKGPVRHRAAVREKLHPHPSWLCG
jgi:hypothetical protein